MNTCAKNKVLYISYDGMTDPLGQSQVIPYLQGLVKKGHEITILSTEKPGNFSKNHQYIESLLKESTIAWHYINYTKTPPVLSTVIDVWKLNRKAKTLHKALHFKTVHCRSYIAALTGSMLKRKFGLRFIFDMRGFYADERVDGKIWNLSNPVLKRVYQYFKHKEKQFLQEADAVVSLTEAGKQEIGKMEIPGFNSHSISVIPCCADMDLFNYNSVKLAPNTKTALGIPQEDFVLCYLGSIGTWYMLPEMLRFFKAFQQENPNSTFLFITKDNAEVILSVAKDINIDINTLKIIPSERKDLPQLLLVCDASIFFIKPVWSKKASSPTKMAELMGMGIPIIANSGVGDVDYFLKDNPMAVLVDNFSENDYKNAILEFKAIQKEKKMEFRAIAETNFSLQEGIERYSAMYEQLSKSMCAY
jgi:glycosyltransferase involved in cell wall biosynthesis